jgi:rubrerythrin
MSKEVEYALKNLYGYAIDEWNEGTTTRIELDQNYKTVKQALERNEPMKIIRSKEPFYSYDHGDNIDKQPSITHIVFRCPKCDKVLRVNIDHHCPQCGQRLDWSNDNE